MSVMQWIIDDNFPPEEERVRQVRDLRKRTGRFGSLDPAKVLAALDAKGYSEVKRKTQNSPDLAEELVELSDCPMYPEGTHGGAAVLTTWANGDVGMVCQGARCKEQEPRPTIFDYLEAAEIDVAECYSEDAPPRVEVVEEDKDEDIVADVLELATPVDIDAAIPEAGYITDTVRWLSGGRTMIPQEFTMATALASVAAINTGRIWTPNAVKEYGLGLWFLLLGRPGGRKTAALDGMSPLSIVVPNQELEQSVVTEALPAAFAEARARWVAHPEFGSFMREAEKKYMVGIHDAMTCLWDGGTDMSGSKRRVGKSGERIPAYSTLTMVGMATLSHFSSWASTDAIKQGFMTRFLVIPQDGALPYRDDRTGLRGNRDERKRLAIELDKRRRLAHSEAWVGGEPPEAQWTDDAWNMLSAYESKWMGRAELLPESLAGFAERIGPIARRISSTYALSRERLTADVEDARHALAFVDYARVKSWPIIDRFYTTQGWMGANMARVEEAFDRLVKRSSDGWVTRREIGKLLIRSLYGPKLDEAIMALVEAGEWEQDQTRSHSLKYRRAIA